MSNSKATDSSPAWQYIPVTWFYIVSQMQPGSMAVPKEWVIPWISGTLSSATFFTLEIPDAGARSANLQLRAPKHCQIRLSAHHIHTFKSPAEAGRRGDPLHTARAALPSLNWKICKHSLAACV